MERRDALRLGAACTVMGVTWGGFPSLLAARDYVHDLGSGQILNIGDNLFSPTSAFKLSMQTDGNLVLSVIDDRSLPKIGVSGGQYVNVIWSSGTGGMGATTVNMQTDGNLVIYAGKNPIWASATQGNPGAFLRCQSDGNLVLYSKGNAIWHSSTFAGRR